MRRTLSLLSPLSLLAVVGCLHIGTVDDVGALDEPEVVDPDDGEHIAEMKTNPRPGDLPEATDARGTDEVRGVPFRWSPRDDLTLARDVSGVRIGTSKSGPWHSRSAAGVSGGLMSDADSILESLGYAEGRAAPGSTHASEPMLDAPARSRGADAGGKEAGRSMPVAQQAPSLRAGTTDDNVDFGDFLEFLASWTDRPGVAGNHVPMDVSDRRFVHVVDEDGDPLPGARVSIIDRRADEVAWSGTTYGDGIAPFYPHLAGADSARGDWLVQAEYHGKHTTVRWDGADQAVQLTVDSTREDGPVDLDVVFLIDTTGSMGDEIARIKSTLLSVTAQVTGLEDGVNLRYGAVLYRDLGDEYLTRHTPLTRDVQGFDQILQGIQANGGGDGPESLNQGLSVAVSEMDWRDDAAKLVFLIADAPPHMDYQDDTTYADASLAALTRGIRIHTVAASGLDDFGSLVFRQSAQLGQGQFVFIEYGSAAASAADHGVTGSVASNNLDTILFRQLEREVEGWGRRSDAQVARR